MNNLPSGWEIQKLGDLAIYEKGKKPKKISTEKNDVFKIPYINIKAFEEKIIDSYTDGEGCVFCEDNDLLIVWDGSRSGYVGKAIKGALGSTLVKLKFPGISSDYVYYFLQSKYREINTRAKGTGTPHVDPNLLWNYELPVPPLPEQHRIVSKIDELFSELDKGIEKLKSIQQQLQAYRQIVLDWAFEGKLTEDWRRRNNGVSSTKELLERISELRREIQLKQKRRKGKVAPFPDEVFEEQLPENWEWVRLQDIAEVVGGITKGRDFKGKKTIKLPYLRVANVQDGYLDLRDVKEIELLEEEKEKYLLRENDILYTEGGDRDKLGRGTIWKNEIDECVHQNHIFRARLYDQSISAKYVAYYSQTTKARNYFYKNAKQTVNLASINLTNLSNLPIPICSPEEQEQIVQEIESRLSVCNKLEETIEECLKQAEALRQSILKKAFEGKLVPQDPNDEPAEELLKRIKVEKEEQQTQQKT